MDAQDIKTMQSVLGVRKPATGDSLPASQARGAVPSAVGKASPQTAPGESAGIASPLDEGEHQRRTYHDDHERTLVSSDGVFTLKIKPIASVQMGDARGRPLTLKFAPPA